MAQNAEVDCNEKDYSNGVSQEGECTEQDAYVQKWSSEEVSSWLRKQGFNEEADIFHAEKIKSKTLLSIEKSDLKELGIDTLGRRLEVYEKVKQLISKGEEKASTKPEVTAQVWKKAITKGDRVSWKPQHKASYLEKIKASRFADINSVEQFIEDQENENTRKKTQQNVALLEEFRTLRNESRLIEEIAPKELNAYIAEFIITVRKKDGNEDYEPSSLRSLMASFERYLKKKNYGFSIMKDAEFEQARKALQSKQKDLKQKGKGNKPNASVALTEEEIKLPYDKELLGTPTPEALLKTIWFNNTIHFGLRGYKEHQNMFWGDVQLRQTTNGEEFLE
ncbi:uncharacterized protein LOC114950176 [Acropora millepora]|uniref:uncharacterized protein LOC114950176 n=1 Tax=Acropora millepora TaxID=45264 RepID=UPI001CF4DA19|nr:uncharacterized protein LOC114950176 [Acropora millepora]